MIVSSFTDAILGGSALSCKADPHKTFPHHSPMARTREVDTDALGTFGRNLRRLIGTGSVNAWASKHGMTQSTINRIVTGDMDPTERVMAKVAAAVGLDVWQMLVPDMDPQNAPVIQDASAAERKLYAELKVKLDELAEIREGGNTRPSSFDASPRPKLPKPRR